MNLIVGLVILAAASWLVSTVLAPLRAIWRGDATQVPRIPRLRPQARTYLPYALFLAPVAGGLGLVALAGIVSDLTGSSAPVVLLARCGIWMFFAGLAMLPVLLFAYLFNLPRVLITPAWRDEPGPLTVLCRRIYNYYW